MFKLTEPQRLEILNGVRRYMQNLTPALRAQYEKNWNDDEFKEELIKAFVDIRFFSQILVASIKQMLDYKIVYNKMLSDSRQDRFEIKELKVYLMNNLLDENLPKGFIDKKFTDFQLREYRRRLAMFRVDYLNLFGEEWFGHEKSR